MERAANLSAGETTGHFFDAVCENWAALSRSSCATSRDAAQLRWCAPSHRLAAGILTLASILTAKSATGRQTAAKVLTRFAAAKAGPILVNINPACRTATQTRDEKVCSFQAAVRQFSLC